MAATFYVIPTTAPSDLDGKIIGFLADAFDKAVTEGVEGFGIVFKEWVPGAAETAVAAFEILKDDTEDSWTVKSIEFGTTVVVNVAAGVAAAALATALVGIAPGAIAAGAVGLIATAVFSVAIDQIITPIFSNLIGEPLENLIEYVTGTLDDRFVYVDVGGREVGGAIFREGLQGTRAVDAVTSLLAFAAASAELPAPAAGALVRQLNDGGATVDNWVVTSRDLFGAMASALAGSGFSVSRQDVENWGWAQDYDGNSVPNAEVGAQTNGLNVYSLQAEFAFQAYNGVSYVQLSLPIANFDFEGRPATGAGVQVLLGTGTGDRMNGAASGASQVYAFGADGFDRIEGSFGADFIFGGEGGDELFGNQGADRIQGEAGADQLYGEAGTDELIGGSEGDKLYGGDDSDELYGESGSDQLDGGAGADMLYGGDGTDLYSADNGDTVADFDGLGTVTFAGIVLRGGEKEADDQNDDCVDPDDAPKNNADNEDKYIGESGEEYVREGGGLKVTSGGSTLIISGWSDGDLGIELKDDDPEEWSPPDCFASPLVLDLDGDGIEIIRLRNSTAFFDIDNDGAAENTAWVSADDGILSLDLNGNGRIDGVSELFGYGETWAGGPGNPSGLSGPGALNQRYTSGFEALAAYDFNADGVINDIDTFYTSLKVWRDLNGDGISEDGELFGLAESGVQSISLTAVAQTREIADSLITDTGSFVRADGSAGEVSDVWFRFDQFDVKFDASRVNDDVAALPQLRASGALSDLHTAMADDPVLRQMVEALTQMGGADLAAFRAGVQEMMFRWAGVTDVSPFSRGAHVDGRELAFLEVVSDTAFVQVGSSNPRTFAGQKLSLQFETILRDNMVRLAAQTDIGDAVIPEVSFNNGAFIDLAPGTDSTPLLDQIFATAPAGWAAAFAHVQAGLMMLDRVYLSFADVAGAADNGATYRANVEARLAGAGFDGISYDVVISANVGSQGDDAILTTSIRGLVFVLPTDLTITGAGDDEVRWGNKEEILLWGAGQGNDEIMADSFFSERESSDISSVIRMQELLLSEVTIGKGQGLLSNDLAITITATGEVLTIRDGLLAENLARVGLLFADGSLVPLVTFEPTISALAQTGSTGDDILFQRTGLVLDGGAGDDVLRGQQGATTYVFGRGYGVDEIFEDIDQRGGNVVQFGADISFEDLQIFRPEIGNPGDLYLRITGTTDELRIYRQFDNTTFIVDRFIFADGSEYTAEDFLSVSLSNDAGDQRVVGSGREEYLVGGTGNDTLSGLRGDDTYAWGAGDGSDVIRDAGLGRYDPGRPISFYREFFVDRGWGDLVNIGYAFDELTASRAGTILTFVHDVTGERLVIDNSTSAVERITFAGNPYVYSLPEVMALIDASVEETGGSNEDDLINGTAGGDLIAAGDGDDSVYGLGGPDTLSGEAGNDLLDGGDRETDNVNTPRDPNTLYGGDGNDTMLGGYELDQLFGGAGDDRLVASFGEDMLFGGAGNDTVLAFDGGTLIYGPGDGDDLLLSADNRFSQTMLEFAAGIAATDVTWSIRNVPIAGLTTYFEFENQATAYALVGTVQGGGSVTLVGSYFADNMAGLDHVRFAQTGQVITTASILAGLFAPSDADQIIVGTRVNNSFAPGGGNDLIVSGGGSDTLSFGLNDGNDTVEGTITRLLLEGGVSPDATVIERLGDRFEDIRVTLADGSTILIPDILSTRQTYEGDVLTQTIGLTEIRFANGTVLTGAGLVTRDLTQTAGNDLVTGDLTGNVIAISAGDDTLRGGGGSDSYSFAAGAGADVIFENNGTPALSSSNFEFTYYNLANLREIDTLTFGAGLTLADLTLTRTGANLDDLQIGLVGSTDTLLIRNQFLAAGSFGYIDGKLASLADWRALDQQYSSYQLGLDFDTLTWGDDPIAANGIERFVFADGTQYTRAQIAALLTATLNDGDNQVGTDAAGGTLDGGAGNDTLKGGVGNDLYVFDRGYGSDTAEDAGGSDVIGFGAGLERGELTLTRTGAGLNDLIIEVAGLSRNALYVTGQFAGDGREVELFTFADGTTLTAADIRNSLLQRSISNGNDLITGFETADVISARRGDDTIEGRGGDDLIDGGTGFDTVVFRGPRSNYDVSVTDGRIVVTDLTGRDGIDRLFDVERLVFGADNPEAGGGVPEVVTLANNQAPVAGEIRFAMAEDGQLVLSRGDLLTGATDPDGASLALTAVGMASSGTLAQTDSGTWRLTPSANFNGVISFTYTVTDAGGLTATGQAFVDVAARNDAPVLGSILPAVSFAEDARVAFTLPADAFADIDSPDLALTATLDDGSALPGWLTFDAATRSFAGQPPANLNGDLFLRVSASDGAAEVSQRFVLGLTAINDAPVATAVLPARVLTAGQTLAIDLPANLFVDPDGDAIGLVATLADGSALPPWILFDPGSATVYARPPATVSGNFDLLIRASDGTLEASVVVGLTVSGGNSVPVLAEPLQDRGSDEDAPIQFTLPAGAFTDAEGDALTLTATLADGTPLPDWLGFNPATRSFAGQPPADFNGTLALQVTASDGISSASGTFDLVIAPVNDAPVARADGGFSTVGQTVLVLASGVLLANDSDVDSLSLGVITVSQAQHGTTTLAPDGTVTYQAEAGYVGNDSFTYTLSDGALTSTGTITVVVQPVTPPIDPYLGWHQGSNGNDLLFADLLCTSRIFGRDGDDHIFGRLFLADSLAGGEGNDQLYGLAGADVLSGNQGADTLYGGWNSDVLSGDSGNDKLFGDSGNDTVDGGLGSDVMAGGDGDDVFIVDDVTDTVSEWSAEGVDTVQAAVSFTLGSNIERLVLTGTAATSGTGNTLDNTITGNAAANLLSGGGGNDVLSGLDGNDTLIGGSGRDTLTGGAGADCFVFDSRTGGIDVIADFNELNGGGEEGDVLRFEGLKVGTFAYLGAGSFTGGSDNTEARVVGNQVLMDTNGDGATDIRITLTGLVNASQLAESDFIFV